MIVDPRTGVVVLEEMASLERAEADVDAYLRSLSPLYEFRRQLRSRIAELRGPAALPPRHRRTKTQAAVADCPRCGTRLGRAA